MNRNREVLTQVIQEGAVIRHVSKHRLPDGTFDREGNLKIWNDALARFDVIPLWEEGAPGFDHRDPLQPQPSLIFIPAPSGARGTVIAAHGGGFQTRTGCEGMNVADYFNRAGFAAAILTYRLAPYTRFDALADMQRAVRLIRARKDEFGVTDKVCAMGFSAGGMLAGNCATHWDAGNPDSADPAGRMSSRPDAVVVGYGAFSDVAFPGHFMDNPFRDEKRADKLFLSVEHHIDCSTPPFFIWQTISDDPRLGFNLGRALTEAGVPFELHVFPDGVHGLALADGNNDLSMNEPHTARWSELCVQWLENLGF